MSVSHAFGFLSVSRAQRTIRRRQVKQQTVAKMPQREKQREEEVEGEMVTWYYSSIFICLSKW